MMSFRTCRAVSFLAALAIVSFGGGCASEEKAPGQNFEKTQRLATDLPRDVDSTLLSLGYVQKATPELLPESFTTYKDSVALLEKEALDSKAQATLLREDVETRIKTWEKEVATMNDPAMKQTMEGRRQAVQENYKLFRNYADAARDAYKPFLAGNQDLVKALTMELSVSAVKSLSPKIERVKADGKVLKEKLAMMKKGLNDIAAGVTTAQK